jgi:hypothetical protein
MCGTDFAEDLRAPGARTAFAAMKTAMLESIEGSGNPHPPDVPPAVQGLWLPSCEQR